VAFDPDAFCTTVTDIARRMNARAGRWLIGATRCQLVVPVVFVAEDRRVAARGSHCVSKADQQAKPLPKLLRRHRGGTQLLSDPDLC